MNHIAVVPAEKLFKYSLFKHITFCSFLDPIFEALLYIRHFRASFFYGNANYFLFFLHFFLDKLQNLGAKVLKFLLSNPLPVENRQKN